MINTIMLEKQLIYAVLKNSGYEEIDSNDEFISYARSGSIGIDISDTTITFIDDTGDFASIPLNYYAMIGFMFIHKIEFEI